MHAIRNYKQSGSTEWSSKNDFESRNFKLHVTSPFRYDYREMEYT